MDELGIVKLAALVLTPKPQGQTKVYKGSSINYVVSVGGRDDLLLKPYSLKKMREGAVKNCRF